MGRVVGPQITRTNRDCPICRPRHAVGPVQQAHNPVRPARCCAIAFAFIARDAAAPDDAGKLPPRKAKARWPHDHIQRGHSRCPDLAAFTAR